ncbi:MAG TPA: hypothetical protein VM759_10765, partial [Longimicrobium sp.]|nr:hypothetical protein [Longimicrobium sp.]
MKKIAITLALQAGALLLGSQAAAAQTPDSIVAVSNGGQSLFRVNVDGGLKAEGIYDGDPSGTGVPVEGAGTRMMWYPRK